MCNLAVSVNNGYVNLSVNNRTVKYMVSPVVERYTKVLDFDKENGILTIMMKCNLLDGTSVEEEDHIDLNEELGFAFKNPKDVVNNIDEIILS